MKSYISELFQMSTGVSRFISSEILLGIAIGIYALVFNLHLLELGFNEAQIGQITSVSTLVMGIFSIPSSLLANKLGRKKLLVIGLLLMGLGYGGIGFTKHFYIIYLSQIIVSIGITLLITSEIQLLFHYSRSKKEETKAFSMLFAVFTLFMGIGTLIGGFLPQLLGGKTTVYQSSILISATLVIIVSFIRGVFLPKEEVINDTKNLISFELIKKQFASKTLWLFSVFTFIAGISFSFVIPFLNIIVKFRFNLSDEWVSMLLTAYGLFLFLGSVSMPYFLDRLGIKRTYFYIFLFNILFSIALAFSIPIMFFIVFLLLRGGSFTLLNNLIDSQTMQVTIESERNLFAGMRSVSRSSGSALASFLAGLILATNNYLLPFLLSGLALVVGYIYFIIWVQPLFLERLEKERL